MNPVIDFSKMSKFELTVVLEAVVDCIKKATFYGGKVYGGFVRDVIIPRLANPSCDVKFKDVDLWFTSQSNADSFISSMGSLFKKFDGISIEVDSYPGAFSRKQYHLTKYNTCLAWIDVIVSPTLPVNDFDVNDVTYTYTLSSIGDWITSSPPRLLHQITNKHAVMLPGYQNLIDRATDCSTKGYQCRHGPHCKRYYQERINRLFISKGWKVSIPSDYPDRSNPSN